MDNDNNSNSPLFEATKDTIIRRAIYKDLLSRQPLREQAIRTVGYTIAELDDWVVRDYGDGRAVEKIAKIERVKRSEKLILD